METLGERLRRAKKTRNVDNAAIAAAAGVHVTTVSRWLNDRSEPDPRELDAAAAFLGVSAHWLRNGTEAPRMVREAAGSYDASSFTQRARAFVNRFLAELAEAGVSEDEESWARRVLTNADNYTLNAGGQIPTSDEEAQLRDIEGMSIGIRRILIARGYTHLPPR